jgi:uncharacterized protein with PQ loop repeat
MDNKNEIIIPYSATTISISARFIFMYLLYTKKSTNNLSLLFCVLNIISSSLWIKYSIDIYDEPILLRSCTDLTLFFISAFYIIHNKYKERRLPILPQ